MMFIVRFIVQNMEQVYPDALKQYKQYDMIAQMDAQLPHQGTLESMFRVLTPLHQHKVTFETEEGKRLTAIMPGYDGMRPRTPKRLRPLKK